MLMVGLTGGIGAGKSAVATRLAGHGAVVVDSDRIAREVVTPGSPGLAAVVAAFGATVLAPDGSLDRAALAATVFGDDQARRRLEQILHPRVRARSAELAAAAHPRAVVVNDVPLLVEVGLAASYHLVVVVEAAEQVRVERLVRGRGMTVEQARARIRAQAGDERRRAAADVLLGNDGRPAELADRVDRLWSTRLLPYEANLHAGRPVWPTAPAFRPQGDPDWPAQAARLAARVAHAAANLPHRIEHIGPTAVPGLAADDVLDVQIGVRSSGEAADLAPVLAAAGLPGRPDAVSRGGPDAASRGLDAVSPGGLDAVSPGGLDAVSPGGLDAVSPGGPDAESPGGPDAVSPAGADRLHGSADPGRPVRLWIRTTGSPGWRTALLMRDYLRADAVARAGYLAAVRAAADRSGGSSAGAVESWFEGERAAAHRWASAAGWPG